MATPTLGLLGYTEIDDADATTSWVGLGTLDPDILKEGANSISGIVRSDLAEFYYDDSTARSTAGEHLRLWINTINTPYMEPESGGGYEVFVFDGTNTDRFTIFGSDTYLGGWFNAVIDCALFTTVTPANVTRWGIRVNHTGNAKNAINTWADYFRYMDGYYITGGSSSDKVRLSDIAVADKGTTTLYGYGIITAIEGVYFGYGELQLGNGSTTTYFEMDGDVLVFTDQPIADGLYAINGNGSGADILIVNSTIKASGTGDDNRPDIDMSTGSPNSVEITATVFIKCGEFAFASGQSIIGNTFNDCQQITTNGADLSGSAVVDSAVAADTGAVYQNVAYTDTLLDNMEFVMGAASHHAIDFGTAVTSNLTLRGIDFSGFGSTDDANDSTVRFLATSGSLTLSLIGCTVDGVAASASNFSVDDAAGITVTVSIDPVDITITVQDEDKDPIENAQVGVFLLDSPFTELMNEDTLATGIASESYPGSLPVEIAWRVRKSDDLDNPRYKAESGTGEITTSGFTLTVTLEEQPLPI